MSRRGLPVLRFLTLNVNGMRGMDRRRELFSTIMTAGYDVIALQETHQEANAHNGQPAGDPQAGAGGAHIGILDITLTTGVLSRHNNRFILPDDRQPSDDSRIRKLIRKYKKEVSGQYKGLRFD